MRTTFLFIAMIGCASLVSCSNKVTCYECRESIDSTNYRDAGCYTKDEWDNIQFTDNMGRTNDKRLLCRER